MQLVGLAEGPESSSDFSNISHALLLAVLLEPVGGYSPSLLWSHHSFILHALDHAFTCQLSYGPGCGQLT